MRCSALSNPARSRPTCRRWSMPRWTASGAPDACRWPEPGRRAATALVRRAAADAAALDDLNASYPRQAPPLPLRFEHGTAVLDDRLDGLRQAATGDTGAAAPTVWLEWVPGRLCANPKQRTPARRPACSAPGCACWRPAPAAPSCSGELVGRDACVSVRAWPQARAREALADLMAAAAGRPVRRRGAAAAGRRAPHWRWCRARTTGRRLRRQRLDRGLPGEGEEACLARLFPDFEALRADGRFAALAQRLFGPFAGLAARANVQTWNCTPTAEARRGGGRRAWLRPWTRARFPLWGSRLIEASAGTGKTWTIAALYLRLVLGHGGEAGFGAPAAAGRDPGHDLHPRRHARAVRPHPRPPARGRELLSRRGRAGRRRPASWPICSPPMPPGPQRAARRLAPGAWPPRAWTTRPCTPSTPGASACCASTPSTAAACSTRNCWPTSARCGSRPRATTGASRSTRCTRAALDVALGVWRSVEALADDVQALSDQDLPADAGEGSLGACIERLVTARAGRARQP